MADLLQFEKDHGFQLPPDYRIFLQHFDGGAVTDLDIGFSTMDYFKNRPGCEHCLYYVLPLRNYQGYSTVVDQLETARSWYLEDYNLGYDYTRDFISIALTGSNVNICLGCSEKYYGKVYLLDVGTTEPGNIDHLFLPLADSFAAFILEVLQPCNEASAQLLAARMSG